ncbi:MAG: hypothetical protein WA637_19615 [Terriglobales bacterium]
MALSENNVTIDRLRAVRNLPGWPGAERAVPCHGPFLLVLLVKVAPL